jgi:peptidoglycan/LPS O-acetylase OafA/YrhL
MVSANDPPELEGLMGTKTVYRRDIQGLRAFAVLSVVIFHVAPDRLPGGFVGVDVFFVISGYLIIGHIWRDLGNGSFSLAKFYSKRAARLFPALFLVALASSAAAYFMFLPSELKGYSESLISSLLYFSNIYFYSEADYFNTALEFAPMLHTWSLGVEEQFYIVLPAILLLLFDRKGSFVLGFLTLLFLLSLGLSEWLLSIDSQMSFYFLPSRLWQFLIGGGLAIYFSNINLQKEVAAVLRWVGLAALITCVVIYDKQTPFPGFSALVPSLATALVLLSGLSSENEYSFTLCNSVARFFGDISYPLYLWHWPVIVFYRLAINLKTGWFDDALMIAVSVVLGYLTWRYVERKNWLSRVHQHQLSPLYLSFLLSFSLVIAGSFWRDGVPQRFSAEEIKMASFLHYKNTGARRGRCFLTSKYDNVDYFDESECINFQAGKKNILLIGDSHAAHWYESFASDLGEGAVLSQATASGCSPLLDAKGARRCTDLMARVFNEFVQKHTFDAIVLSARWQPEDASKIADTTEFLRKYVNKVIVLGPIVEYETSLPRLLAMQGRQPENLLRYRVYASRKTLDNVLKDKLRNTKAIYVSVIDAVCADSENCLTATPDQIPLQFDYGHLTAEGARLILSRIRLGQYL